jgi:uncharacterized membrane protein
MRDPPRYNHVMGLHAIPPVARLFSGAIAYVTIVIAAVWMLGREAWSFFVVAGLAVFAVVGPMIGAALVWLIVRRTNRRHDPQQGPDGPSTR